MTFKSVIENTSIEYILRKEFPDIVFNANESDTMFELNILIVKYKERHKGKGSKFMKRLLELAREKNKTIALRPDDSYAEKDDMNTKQLKDWYKKLGFIERKYKNFTMIYR